MSQYHLTRIASVLDQTFSSLIDMDDWAGRKAEDSRAAYLSRSLAALCIKMIAGADDKTAAGTLVDGFDDSGIDALFFDQVNDAFYFVQSKWNSAGNKPINEAGSGKFADGVRELLAGNLGRFNSKIKSKENEILAALRASRLITIVLITVHSAEPEIGLHGRRKIDDLVEELNVPSVPEQARAIHLNQEEVYRLITSFATPAKIDVPITLSQFGFTERPFLSYYGRANLIEVAGWWKDYGRSLCDRNIRHFFHRSDVNDALKDTLVSNPEYFWYFNNGITIICDSVVKSLTGSPGTALGLFNCKGVSVVNGAQTVGVIGSILPQAGAATEAIQTNVSEESWVQVRIISLEKCPPGFDRKITQATNFQNAVVRRDFAAMDPVQHRLATDFSLDGRRYVYKSGEEDPHGDDGCSITEATQALGCAASIELAVQVKREISELWWKIDRSPYTDLFSQELTSVHLWKSVRVLRAVDEELQKLRRSPEPRADMIAVHLNRVLLHLVFRSPGVMGYRRDDLPEEHLVQSARDAINEIFPRAAAYIEEKHPYDYLASFCKNREKCAFMSAALLNPGHVEPSESQLSLFST